MSEASGRLDPHPSPEGEDAAEPGADDAPVRAAPIARSYRPGAWFGIWCDPYPALQ